MFVGMYMYMYIVLTGFEIKIWDGLWCHKSIYNNTKIIL